MATKQDMRDEILRHEPDNEIANSDAGHTALKAELSAVKRRASSKKSSTISVLVKYRLESGEHMSWKLCRRDTGEPVTMLSHGYELPLVGHVETVDDISYKVTGQESGLEITAGDLAVREAFDSRRIYSTPNGTNVVFKRLDKGRAVLWSYKTQNEIMLGVHVDMVRTDKKAKPTACLLYTSPSPRD